MDLWPDSSRHRPLRTRHSDGEPGGSRPGLTRRTAVAIRMNRIKNKTVKETLPPLIIYFNIVVS